MSTESQDKQEKRGVGRPLKYKTVASLNKAIASYFKRCDPHWVYEYDWVLARDPKGGLKKDEHGQNYYEWLKTRRRTEQQPYTVSGLACALGISRDTLVAYRERPEFVDSIQAAYERCHEWAEKMLFVSPAGAAFSLKNNWGWRDRQEIDHTTKGQAMPLLGGTTPLLEDDDATEADDEPQENPAAP